MRSTVTAGICGAVLLIAGAGALAAPAPKAAPKAAAPVAGGSNWVVNKAASSIVFNSKYEGDAFNGRFNNWDAQISFDPKNLAAAKVVTTIRTGQIKTSDEEADGVISTGMGFDAGKFPAATFTSTSFKDLGAGKYQVAGNVTIKGVSQPVVLNGSIAINGATAKANFTTTLDRSKFSVGTGQFKSPETIPNAVQVVMNITAARGK